MTKRIALLIAILVACKRDAPAPAPSTSSSPAPSTAPVASAAPTTSASATPAAPPNRFQAIALRWSDALNAHDERALRELHAPTVKFYGSTIDNAEYVSRIKKALAKDPAFHQTLAFTTTEWINVGNVKVSFRKKDDKRETPAYVVIQRQSPSDVWLIAEESDLPSDAIPPTCYDYGPQVTLTGNVVETQYMVNDRAWPATVLELARPICVRAGKQEEEVRVDSIDRLHLRDGTKPAPGKRTVTGVLMHQDGSPYWASSVALQVGWPTR